MEKDLTENWTLRNANYNKDVLFATLMNKGASFGVLYENPMMFKYMSDAWFEKHKRTFEKWFDAFDIPYAPLENYGRNKDTITNVKEDRNSYDRHKEQSDVNSTHIGDSFSNEDLTDRTTENLTSQETVDEDTSKHLTSQEVTDLDTTEHLTSQEVTDQDTTDNKSSNTEEVTSETSTKTFNDTHLLTEQTTKAYTESTTGNSTGSTHTTEDSGKYIPQYDEHGHITGYTLVEDSERMIEYRTSAYNDGEDTNAGLSRTNGYVPKDLTITHGSMTTSENTTSNSSGQKASNETDDHSVTQDTTDHTETDTDAINKTTNYQEAGTGTLDKTVDFESNKTGTEDKTVDFESNESGTDDKQTDFESNKIGTDTKNVQTTANDKYNEVSTNKSFGDSQSNDSMNRQKDENMYTHGIFTGSYQDLLSKEVNVQMFTIYDQMAELFCDEMCIRIYLSPRQRGGCWCDY